MLLLSFYRRGIRRITGLNRDVLVSQFVKNIGLVWCLFSLLFSLTFSRSPGFSCRWIILRIMGDVSHKAMRAEYNSVFI